jgi:hypothetical protein
MVTREPPHPAPPRCGSLPFGAPRDGLRDLDASGLTGSSPARPFGGAYVHGWGIRVWAVGYLCVALALAVFAFSRRDL